MRSASVRRLLSEGDGRENSEAVGFSDRPPPFIYDARSVISHPIEMNDLDCSALGFRGMGWTGPRSNLTGRAKRGIFGPFLFLVQIYVF